MSKKYLHLNDTNFPNVDGVNPYKYHNNFDYSRWRGLVAIKLVNVKWNNNYSDVPIWDSNIERDAFFDEIDGIIKPLETLFNTTPESTVKIPIPFNDAYNYNYLVVDMPIQTSAEQPIAYEDENVRIKRWYYFINDMAQYSPNTTELKISLDYWTMFINTVSIPYLLLERGHAPMAQTSVEEYLSNPLENNEYLLAEDFNYGNSNIIKHTDYYPIGNGSKYVLFAIPMTKSDFMNLIPGSNLGNSTRATFSNTSHQRWGYQYQVNGYEWNYGGKDFSNSKLPVKNILSNDGNLYNGVNVFAIKADEATSFFNIIASKYTYLLNAIQACFILGSDMFARNDSFTFEGYTVYKCVKNTEIDNISLTKNDFDFDERYEDITKLYTFPYSVLEITDDNGKTFEIKVECTNGNMQMRNEINIAYPYMNYNILFTGINGNGTQQYIWSEISANKNKTIWEDDFSKYMLTWDIPTFSLFVSAETDFNVTNYPKMQAQRNGAIVDYMNSVRYADVGYENTEDSLATQRQNAFNSASTARTNAKNAADTDKTNDDNTSNTNKNNNDATSNQHKQNADASANTDYDNTGKQITTNIENIVHGAGSEFHLAYLNKEMNNWLIDEETRINADKLYADRITDNNFSVYAYNANVEAELLSTATNMAATAATAAITAGGSVALGAATGGISTAVTAGAMATGANALVSAGSAAANVGITITKDYNLVMAAIGQYEEKTLHATTNMDNIRDRRKIYNDTNYSNTIVNNGVIANRTKDANNYINNHTWSTNLGNNSRTNNRELANNTRTNNTELTNNANTRNMRYDNADNTYNTDTTNATNVYNTEEPNARWNRESAVEAAKWNLGQKQLEMDALYKSMNLSKPVTKGIYNGDANPDLWERRGVRVNVRTQTKSAIAQTGDAMLRFGYALNRVWDMDNGFKYMKHFTYWKASDIWINDGDGTAGDAVDIIRNIILAGVTVWNNAEEIGTISIYDNLEYNNE